MSHAGNGQLGDGVRRFKRYPAYKESGIPWLGEHPSTWHQSRLKYCVHNFLTGGTPESTNESYWSNADEDGIPWVTIGDMTRSAVVSATDRKISQAGLDSKRLQILPHGTLLYSIYASLGKVAVLAIPAVVNQAILGIVPNREKAHQEYLRYWLQHMEQHLSHFSSTNTQHNLNADKVRTMPVFIPRIAEQRQIAVFLEQETAKLDDLVVKKEQLIELLQEKRTALISHAVTKGLDPKVSMKDSGVEWLGEIPVHWEVKRLKYVCKLETGHTPRKSDDRFWIPDECTIPWISLNDTKTLESSDFIDDTKVKISLIGMSNSTAHLIDAEMVVFNRDGARVGLSAITTKPMCVSQHVIGWVCGPAVHNYFLLHVLYAMEQEIYRLTAGATIPTIGMTDVKRMVMPVPPLDEQKDIAQFLVRERDRLTKLISRVKEHVGVLREFRTSLISAAVTGQIDVREEVA